MITVCKEVTGVKNNLKIIITVEFYSALQKKISQYKLLII